MPSQNDQFSGMPLDYDFHDLRTRYSELNDEVPLIVFLRSWQTDQRRRLDEQQAHIDRMRDLPGFRETAEIFEKAEEDNEISVYDAELAFDPDVIFPEARKQQKYKALWDIIFNTHPTQFERAVVEINAFVAEFTDTDEMMVFNAEWFHILQTLATQHSRVVKGQQVMARVLIHRVRENSLD